MIALRAQQLYAVPAVKVRSIDALRVWANQSEGRDRCGVWLKPRIVRELKPNAVQLDMHQCLAVDCGQESTDSWTRRLLQGGGLS